MSKFNWDKAKARQRGAQSELEQRLGDAYMYEKWKAQRRNQEMNATQATVLTEATLQIKIPEDRFTDAMNVLRAIGVTQINTKLVENEYILTFKINEDKIPNANSVLRAIGVLNISTRFAGAVATPTYSKTPFVETPRASFETHHASDRVVGLTEKKERKKKDTLAMHMRSPGVAAILDFLASKPQGHQYAPLFELQTLFCSTKSFRGGAKYTLTTWGSYLRTLLRHGYLTLRDSGMYELNLAKYQEWNANR